MEKFQAYLSPEYQLKVMAMSLPYMVMYQGPPAPLIIRLSQFEDHYHGCRSYMGFLERSYFCDECNRGYNNEDFRHLYFLVKLTWMWNWMGSHFLDWIEWGLTFVGILE